MRRVRTLKEALLWMSQISLRCSPAYLGSLSTSGLEVVDDELNAPRGGSPGGALSWSKHTAELIKSSACALFAESNSATFLSIWSEHSVQEDEAKISDGYCIIIISINVEKRENHMPSGKLRKILIQTTRKLLMATTSWEWGVYTSMSMRRLGTNNDVLVATIFPILYRWLRLLDFRQKSFAPVGRVLDWL